MRARDRRNKELKDIHATIRTLFPTYYTLVDGKRDYRGHQEVNVIAIKHRTTLSEIAEQYDGDNYNEIITKIRSKAKRIIQHNGVW